MTTARLFLSGIRASGRHGARPGEKDEPQDFVVDLDIEVNVGDDDIDGHRRLPGHHRDASRAIVEQRSFDLIESMAAAIADEVLALDRVARVTAVVHKPNAAEPPGHRRRRRGRHRPEPMMASMDAYLGSRLEPGGPARHAAAAPSTCSAAEPGITVRRTSRVWETDPVGGPTQPDFLNIVVEIDTDLEPLELLDGRQPRRSRRSAACGTSAGVLAPIDIDILLIDDLTIDDDRLTVPHPRMHERAFVLLPLLELIADPILPDGTRLLDVRLPDQAARPSPRHWRRSHDRRRTCLRCDWQGETTAIEVPGLRAPRCTSWREAPPEGAGAEVRSHSEERSREAASTASVAPSAAPPRPSSPPPRTDDRRSLRATDDTFEVARRHRRRGHRPRRRGRRVAQRARSADGGGGSATPSRPAPPLTGTLVYAVPDGAGHSRLWRCDLETQTATSPARASGASIELDRCALRRPEVAGRHVRAAQRARAGIGPAVPPPRRPADADGWRGTS